MTFFKKQSIKQALFFGTKKLSTIQNPKLEAEVLLSEVLQKPRIFLKTHSEMSLNFRQKLLFFRVIIKRKKRIPVAYIFKKKLWAGLTFSVNENTLIPRDETEELVFLIQKKYKQNPPKKILDIGTGSGCISVFLARCFPKACLTALDISAKALAVAQKNAQTFGLKNISFQSSNLLQSIPKNSCFDLIVANLPYVPTSMIVSKEVQQEPFGAIFSGDDGLNHIRELADQLRTKNIEFGALWLEFLPEQKDEILKIFSGFVVHFHTNIAGEVFFSEICMDPETE